MKVRVIQKNEEEFEPQWFDEETNKWKTAYSSDDFGMEYWYSIEEAQNTLKEFVAKHKRKNGKVVWEADL